MNDNITTTKNIVKIKRNSAERDMVINGTHIHVKSIFSGKIPLEKALSNIATRKLAKFKK